MSQIKSKKALNTNLDSIQNPKTINKRSSDRHSTLLHPFFITKSQFSIKELAEKLQCKIKGKIEKDTIIKAVNTLENAKSGDITFFANKKYFHHLLKCKATACFISEEDFRYYFNSSHYSITDSNSNLQNGNNQNQNNKDKTKNNHLNNDNSINNADNKESIDTVTKQVLNNITFLISKNPQSAYAELLELLYKARFQKFQNNHQNKKNNINSTKIGKNTIIEEGAYIGCEVTIGQNCYIASGSYIDDGVTIGNNVTIGSNSTITHSIIGNNVILHAGVKIGQEGFGFTVNHKNKIIKIQQIGAVEIHNNVEIGANSCIDRGAILNTIIMENTKIDNLVQIAHNVIIGKNCFIAAQSGIAGSTKIGSGVMIGGQVGISGHLNIGNNVQIAAKSGVIHDIANGEQIGGYPAIQIRKWHGQNVILKKMLNKKQTTNHKNEE